MQEYKTEMEPYEAKYHMPFERFEKMIEREKEENFEHWDDFIIWEGLYEGFEMWRTKYQVLKEYV
jgi:hypothetical protein